MLLMVGQGPLRKTLQKESVLCLVNSLQTASGDKTGISPCAIRMSTSTLGCSVS